jgi:hypothetical protein
MEREQAEKNVENAWQNWEMAKRLVEQEKMKAHESRRNEEIGGDTRRELESSPPTKQFPVPPLSYIIPDGVIP